MKGRRALLVALVLLAGLVLSHGLPRAGGVIVSAKCDSLPDGDGTGQEKVLVAIGASGGAADSTLYTLDPDGSGQTRLFDFHAHPRDATGGIWDLRIGPGGGAIYFASDSAYLYTPASRNLFRIAADGGWWEQLTPGPNSGRWNQPCPCGVVEGIVRRGNGDPWPDRPVYLEGKEMVYSGADGRFRYENVPVGARWLMAYRGAGEDVFAAQVVSVMAGVTAQATLSPDTSYRMEFGRPAPYGDRIYHVLAPHKIQWTTAGFSPPVEVYVNTGACTGIPDIDGFDVAPTTGRLAIVNYQEGCGAGDTMHRGVYLADKDGQGVRLLVDMMADWNWCGAGEIFWSADESRLAAKACYKQNHLWYTYLVVFDAGDCSILGYTYFPVGYTMYNVSLHGWSPDGRWLLYSAWINDTNTGLLARLPVNSDGGQSWETLVSMHPTTTFVLNDVSTLRGGNRARIRVIASDGVNTGMDESDAVFTATDKPPQPHIDATRDAAALPEGDALIIGGASDPEDGNLGDSALSWQLNGQVVGVGRELLLSGLGWGFYTVELTAADSQQNRASVSIAFRVGNALWLPYVLR